MSAIFGLIHFDGSPVETEDLTRMQQALAYWGGDGGGVWQQDNVGLGCHIRQITPESRYEIFPVTGAAGNLWLTGTARLDNREDLCRTLGIPQAERPTTPDTRLLLSAYEHWGGECAEHLLGDWSLAVWDQPRRRLFLARDHHGITAFYYYYNSRFLAFASGMKGLLALPRVPKKLNPLRMAQILTVWPGDGVETGYDGILRLPPAHSLSIVDGRAVKRRFWRAEETPELHLPRTEDYQELFLELYQKAVNSRLRSLRPIGATLSGGLDSGSVCTLAARKLAAAGRRLPVFSAISLSHTENLVPPYRFGDESPYIKATARWAGNIDITYITAAEISPVDGIRRGLRLNDEPGTAAANMYWITALLKQAQQRGLGVLLTGQCGNATVSWGGGPVNLWTLLFSGHWQALQKELQLISGPQKGTSVYYLLRNQILKPVVQYGRHFWQQWRRRGVEAWEDYAAINHDWARSLDLRRKMLADGHDPSYWVPDLREHRLAILQPQNSIIGNFWAEFAAGYGLDVRDPTLDKKLMEFCLGVPNHIYYRRGQYRLLLRESFAGLMPPQVLWNQRKGLQAADITYRVHANISETEEILSQLAHSALAPEYLDLPKMQRVLESLRTGFTWESTTQCYTFLLRGLMVGLFLQRFDGSR